MGLAGVPFAPGDASAGLGVVRSASAPAVDAGAMGELRARLGPGPFALVILFVSNVADAAGIARLAADAFGRCPVIGCTTAGEIGSQGYVTGEIVAVALPAADFAVSLVPIEAIATREARCIQAEVLHGRRGLAAAVPDWRHEFAMLLVDGLSRAEDRLVSAIAPALGTAPLFGGSAGDGLDFGRTFVIWGGEARVDAAVLALVRTRCAVEVFRFDNFRPTERRLVVTAADPQRRIVRELNAEPAAAELARAMGTDPEALTHFTFASSPVVVRLGGEHHVRAIQQAEPDGCLRFFAAIDEGIVLSLAEQEDMVAHLDGALSRLAVPRRPAAIIACDCILRRLAAEGCQRGREVSEVLARHGVVGFSTYGEQHNALHVNQTLTGVAIYPPGPG